MFVHKHLKLKKMNNNNESCKKKKTLQGRFFIFNVISKPSFNIIKIHKTTHV